MKKPIVAITLGLMLLPSLLAAQPAPLPGDRGLRPEAGRPGGGRLEGTPGGGTPGGGGPGAGRPQRPGGPQIRPPGPGGEHVRPPRPGDGHIRPPRPGEGSNRPRPPRPGQPRPPGFGKPDHGNRPGFGRPPSHNFRPIRGNPYRYPRGHAYRRWTIGLLLPSVFLSSAYYYDDYTNFGLDRPPAGFRWVRNGPDLILIDLRTRRIHDVIYGAFY